MSPKFWNMVAQNSHWLGSMVLIGWTVLLFGDKSILKQLLQTALPALYVAVPIFIIITGWKELWFDPHVEHPEKKDPDWEDLAFYVFGIALGLSLLWLKAR